MVQSGICRRSYIPWLYYCLKVGFGSNFYIGSSQFAWFSSESVVIGQTLPDDSELRLTFYIYDDSNNKLRIVECKSNVKNPTNEARMLFDVRAVNG